MDWEQIQTLRDAIQGAIEIGMRDGFASQEKPPPVTVTLPKPIELRDFFAGCALIGELASQDIRHETHGGRGTGIAETPFAQARACYEQADSMLVARNEDHA